MRRAMMFASARAARAAHVRGYSHTQQLVRDALQEAREQLRAALPASMGDAKPLVASALRPPLARSSDVFLHLDRQARHTLPISPRSRHGTHTHCLQLTREETQTLSDALARRCRGEPLAYVTGSREFWSLPFRVSPSTLIPRSDSEVLIETLAAQYAKQSALRILDVGTGSGCLLLAALSEFPRATGVGIDISRDALQVAHQNADDLALATRAQFLQYDLRDLPRLDAARAKDETAYSALFQQFDVVLCNPPYIPRGELHLVADDVLAHEPHLALFSDGPDAVKSGSADESDEGDDDRQGLRMYRWLQQSVPHLFKPTSLSSPDQLKRSLILEIGSEEQARAVHALFSAPSTRHLVFQQFLFDGQQRHRGLLFQTVES